MSDAASSPSLAHRWLRRLAFTIAAIVALIVVAWLAVPPIVRSQLESRLTEALGRPTTVREVAFDPFKLEVTLRDVAIGAPSGPATLITIDELVANISSASIYHRAPVLDGLKLTHPVVTLSRDAKGEYSVRDIVDRIRAQPEGPAPRFSLNNIEIVNAALTFDDGVTSRKHAIESLGVGIPFLSTLPYQTDVKVTPHLDGRFNGSHFALTGNTVPFAERREATLDIDFDALPLAQYVVYLPDKPAYVLADGTLTTRLKVAFVDGKPGERRLEIRGDAQVDRLALERRDGSPLLGAEQLAVVIDRVDVFGHDIRIASATARAPSADVKRLADGRIELAQPWLERAPPARTATPDAPWTVAIAKATLAGGSLTMVDEGSTFRTALADVSAEATNLSTKAGEKAHVTLSFVSADRIASLKGEADVEPMAPAAEGTFDLRKFSLALLFPYYKDALAVDVQSGSLDYASAFTLAANGDLKLTSGNGTVSELKLAFPGATEPLWRVPQLTNTLVIVAENVRANRSPRSSPFGWCRTSAGTPDVWN